MKKYFSTLLSAILAASVAFPTLAADIPSRKAAPIIDPPPPMWTGFYSGLNAGGTWSNNNSARITTWPLANDGG